jgi:L-threonylcarbamoyladenylate synthase
LETAKKSRQSNRRADPEAICKAAERLRAGGLVIFPTETVYGLGANALDAEAVAKIYRVKGRPSTSPLIVHVAALEQAQSIVAHWPESAHRLALRFWPGPLTLVLRKRPIVPDIVTAGLATVGVRMPDHPVALELIRRAGVPVAAPSANRFTELSPTRVEHLPESVRRAADAILDGGPSPVGIESTVLSLAADPPQLLRPGMISRTELEAIVGPVAPAGRIEKAHPAPGMHRKHYAPATRLVLVSGSDLPATGRGAYLWLTRPAPAARVVAMPSNPADYAARLYDVLHELDREGYDWIAVERPPAAVEWAAILDRLERAAGSPGEPA